MPLVRFEVRNEVALGDPELYGSAARKAAAAADSKALLEGVAVAGLVGILRQLGDLAEFAADIFHDLHEQLATTAARARKVLTRVHNIETALPSLEKAVKGQTSHIHFAYMPGSDWHANIRIEQSHMLSSDLPRFMMDLYEECRDPPRLYLLDKFDSGGAGACLKRYSDPSYFKRASDIANTEKSENIQREKRAQRMKRKGSRLRNGDIHHATRLRNTEFQHSPSANQHSSRRFASKSPDEQSFSEIVSRSSSFGSKTRLSLVEQALDTNPSVSADDGSHYKPTEFNVPYKLSDASSSILHDGTTGDSFNNDSKQNSLLDHTGATSSSVTWDEKDEIVMPTGPSTYEDIVMDIVQDTGPMHNSSGQQEGDYDNTDILEHNGTLHENSKVLVLSSGLNQPDEITSETDNYMDAFNTLESETETEAECQTKKEMNLLRDSNLQGSQTEEINNIASQLHDISDTEAPGTSVTWTRQNESPDASNTNPSEMSEQMLSPYMNGLHIVVRSSSTDDTSESNAQDASGKKIDGGVGFNPCTESTVSHLQTVPANYVMEKSCIAQYSDDFCAVASDISESNANDDFEKSIEGGDMQYDCSISTPQSIVVNESLEKSTTTQDSVINSPTVSHILPSTKLWTNAGLFGLEPSKPPDFGARNGFTDDMLSSSRELPSAHSSDSANVQLHHATASKTTEAEIATGNVSVTSNFAGELAHSAVHRGPSTNELAVRIPEKISSIETSHCTSSEDNQQKSLIGGPNPSREFQKTQEITSNGPECDPYDSTRSISSSFSSIAQRFLANTLNRRASPAYADLSAASQAMPSDTRKSDESPLSENYNTVPNGVAYEVFSQSQWNREKTIHDSSKLSISSSDRYSEQSSPPLEHMKISFHPMNASETSKQQLEFPNGNLQSADDFMLPKFQFLPGSSYQLPGSGSLSDDDTFCRSCSYSSYDDLSPRMYSNSELWDEDEGIRLEEPEFYDYSQKIASTATPIATDVDLEQLNFASMNVPSGLADMEAANRMLSFKYLPAVELPNFDSLMPANDKPNGFNRSLTWTPQISTFENQDEMPPPPPLPPMQWRMMRPTASLEEDKRTRTTDRFQKISSLPPLRPMSEQQQQLVPIAPSAPVSQSLHTQKVHDQNSERIKEPNNLPNIMELNTMKGLPEKIRTKHDQQKMNGQESPKRDELDSKDVDEREELLHQIRSKTFNLKRTGAVKPSPTPRPTEAPVQKSDTNSNVAAILEKANAIRQAVASDDGGDDDTWSDT